MRKIISAQQMQQVDKYTIKNKPIVAIDLMEEASMSFINEFIKEIDFNDKIHIFCGMGNNGGDGFAIARILKTLNFNVHTYLVQYTEQMSASCKINFEKLKNVQLLSKKDYRFELNEMDIVVDAIFGSGLSRPINGFIGKIVEKINTSNRNVFCVDIPSGLFANQATKGNKIIQAKKTITFQRPKLSFFLSGYGDYVNNWSVVDIGLIEKYIESKKSYYYWIQNEPEKWIKKRKKFAHKGDFGHAYLIGGSYGKMGAELLAAKACLDHGVGLLTLHVPKCGYEIMQIAVPRAMCTIDASYKYITKIPVEKWTYGIGHGLSTNKKTIAAFNSFLKKIETPIVLDADALNIIAQYPAIIKDVPANSIFTPHPKEFSRLVGTSKNSFEELEKLSNYAKKNKIIVVLKGAHTAIASPDGNVYFNTTGSPKLAQAGSGDILTGIITSYLAQAYEPLKAAILGVYLHGKNGG